MSGCRWLVGEWNNRLSVVQYEEIVREDERQAHPREVSSCFSWFSLGSQTYYSCTSHLEMVPCDMKSKMQFHVLTHEQRILVPTCFQIARTGPHPGGTGSCSRCGVLGAIRAATEARAAQHSTSLANRSTGKPAIVIRW